MFCFRKFTVFTAILLCLCAAVSRSRAEDSTSVPSLTLTADVSEITVYMEVKLKFVLHNPTAQRIDEIPDMDYEEDDEAGVRIYVIFEETEKRIRRPWLQLIQKDRACDPCPPPGFSLDPGQTAGMEIALTLDWSPETPVFSKPGIYRIYGTHSIPGYGLIRSNEIGITVRSPVSANEAEAVALLRDTENLLNYLYRPELLVLYETKADIIKNHVAAVRRIYEMDPPTPFREPARKALLYWRAREIRAKGSDIPRMKEQGFDRLGLTGLGLSGK